MQTLQFNDFIQYLKPRPRDFHKGNCGHVLIVGGDFGFSGAVRMAAEAALRIGAGLVSIATRPEIALTLTNACPELMCHGINKLAELDTLIKKANVIVIGPGLGKSDWAHDLLHLVLLQEKPLIVDADALNIMAEKKISLKKSNWVLTPHPGEAARLLNLSVAEIQADRESALKKLVSLYGGNIVLKGAGTLVGYAEEIFICHAGNPGMASGGMGDILSGVIAGLAAQQISLTEAVKLGVLLHAMAGDLAAADYGERGMIATDLLPYLHKLVNPEKK